MSLWYDVKHKNYSSNGRESWIRSYAEKIVAELRDAVASKFTAHFSGSVGRHAAADIDCTDGKTVQAALDGKAPTAHASDTSKYGAGTSVNYGHVRLADNLTTTAEGTALAANQGKILDNKINAEIRERAAADSALDNKISDEVQTRAEADLILQENIDTETANREKAVADLLETHNSELAILNNAKVDKVNGRDLSSNDYTNADKSKLAGIESGAQVNSVTSVAGKTGTITLIKDDVGLGNVDNTSDLDKPVSAAMQNALNLKVNTSVLNTELAKKADKSEVLTKTNTVSFTPTGNYQPATKKYVDDSVSAAGGGDMLQTVYDSNGDGVVDSADTAANAVNAQNAQTAVSAKNADTAVNAENAAKLGGQEPSYYAKKADADSKAPKSHASAESTYGVGTSSSYGHLKIANNLTTATASGVALSAAQGKVLDEKITAITSSVSTVPPSLTAVSPDGTKIGTSSWTGTGFFCKDTNIKYSVIDTRFPAINGFCRFCLKPSDNSRKWQNWTPFFDYNGSSYEFFFIPSRGLYEALIPAVGMTAAQIVSSIRWENFAPTQMRYGRSSCALGYYKDTADEVGYWVKSEAEARESFGGHSELDTYCILGIVTGDYDFSTLSVVHQSLILLTCDCTANGRIASASWGEVGNSARYGDALSLDSIDNFA